MFTRNDKKAIKRRLDSLKGAPKLRMKSTRICQTHPSIAWCPTCDWQSNPGTAARTAARIASHARTNPGHIPLAATATRQGAPQ